MLVNISTETGGNLPVNVSFDLYGNLYFDVNGIKNNEYFTDGLQFNSLQINVDGRNRIYGEEGDFNILETKKDKLNKFKLTEEHSKLQHKTVVELTKNTEELEVYNMFDDGEIDPDMVDPYEEEIKYFPERAEFFETDAVSPDEIINEDVVNTYGHHNVKFIFSHSSDDSMISIQDREDGDVTALYDTYVYQNENLCFKSSSKDDESLYTIKIHDNGTFYFRPHGFKGQEYKVLFTKNGKLLFIHY